MSSLDSQEKRKLEKLFHMSTGYVVNFSDATFADLFIDTADIDIHSQKYQANGTSKAKKLREFWRVESDPLVGTILLALIEHCAETTDSESIALAEQCRNIARRLTVGGPNLAPLKEVATQFDAKHLAQQLKRMEQSIESDPDLAIGQAKELVETCCKTILRDRGVVDCDKLEVQPLVRRTMEALKLVPNGIAESAKGTKTIKAILGNLATVTHGLAELRNLYGTGHGKHGRATGLQPRHAKLAGGAAATLTTFLFDTHIEHGASKQVTQ